MNGIGLKNLLNNGRLKGQDERCFGASETEKLEKLLNIIERKVQRKQKFVQRSQKMAISLHDEIEGLQKRKEELAQKLDMVKKAEFEEESEFDLNNIQASLNPDIK